MIAPLRERHRRTSAVMGLLALASLVLGTWARPTPLPGRAGSEPRGIGPGGLELPELALRAELRHDEGGSGGAHLVLEPTAEPSAPDILVYLAGRPPTEEEGVPAGAWLLGTLGGRNARSYVWPADAPPDAYLVLYSLAWGERLGSARLSFEN